MVSELGRTSTSPRDSETHQCRGHPGLAPRLGIGFHLARHKLGLSAGMARPWDQHLALSPNCRLKHCPRPGWARDGLGTGESIGLESRLNCMGKHTTLRRGPISPLPHVLEMSALSPTPFQNTSDSRLHPPQLCGERFARPEVCRSCPVGTSPHPRELGLDSESHNSGQATSHYIMMRPWP